MMSDLGRYLYLIFVVLGLLLVQPIGDAHFDFAEVGIDGSIVTTSHTIGMQQIKHEPGTDENTPDNNTLKDEKIVQDEESSESQPQQSAQQRLLEQGSSVWCTGESHTSRRCRFSNLCYNPAEDDWVFLHSKHSVMAGLPKDRFSPTLLDMSSVQDHNMQYFNYVDLPVQAAQHFQINVISTPSLLFRRFNPDNLMHVFHDDLLPLYHTMVEISGNVTRKQPFNIKLVFMEGWMPGNYMNLYKLLSSHNPIFRQDLQSTDALTCFTEAHVGVTKETTWYQYGFRIPQGPLTGHGTTAREIRHFTDYLKHSLVLTDDDSISGDDAMTRNDEHIILLSRKSNRLILNEVDLSMELARYFGRKVLTVGEETHSIRDMIQIIAKGSILVGMHGSLLSLAMFLPVGGILVEMFPYAVNPNNYTPYKTMVTLPSMNIKYRSWRNMYPSASVGHASRYWEEGGIHHLSREQQSTILASKQVPLHLCCNNPEWLYRIYQDTVVDIPSILSLIEQSLQNNSQDHVHNTMIHTSYPSQVRGLQCASSSIYSNSRTDGVHKNSHEIKMDGSRTINNNSTDIHPPCLYVSWKPPWNMHHLYKDKSIPGGHGSEGGSGTTEDQGSGSHGVDIQYEVWIQESGSEQYSAWVLSSTSYKFTMGLKPDTAYRVWVRSFVGSSLGPFNSNVCKCKT